MKLKLATTCFVIGSVLAPVVAYAADGDADRSKPVHFVKDSVITTKIKTKLAAEHPASAKHIHVDTDKNGVVWLSGTTDSQRKPTKPSRLRAIPRASNRSTPSSRSRKTASRNSKKCLAPGRFDAAWSPAGPTFRHSIVQLASPMHDEH